MSQRLLISEKKNLTSDDEIYDCIYTEESSSENLISEWIGYDPKTGYQFGPLKIRIRDYSLMDKFIEDFKKLKSFGINSFDEIWGIYDESGQIHESQIENKKYMSIINKVIENIRD